MADDTKDAEAKLEKLADRVRREHKKLHPVKREHIKLVRTVAREAWDQKNNRTTEAEKKAKQQEHDDGHSH